MNWFSSAGCPPCGESIGQKPIAVSIGSTVYEGPLAILPAANLIKLGSRSLCDVHLFCFSRHYIPGSPMHEH